ncbi:hypothetical protein EYF80_035574 [Liparis tanakae]|uniref:Uncharacterized protein n=1 Tax=Liparis tanakae TaxID=230148 RepID=A0A4Z2GNG8_9TELE|nr:hypothetical protein EYF80_035574 [Liparis tanakae]
MNEVFSRSGVVISLQKDNNNNNNKGGDAKTKPGRRSSRTVAPPPGELQPLRTCGWSMAPEERPPGVSASFECRGATVPRLHGTQGVARRSATPERRRVDEKTSQSAVFKEDVSERRLQRRRLGAPSSTRPVLRPRGSSPTRPPRSRGNQENQHLEEHLFALLIFERSKAGGAEPSEGQRTNKQTGNREEDTGPSREEEEGPSREEEEDTGPSREEEEGPSREEEEDTGPSREEEEDTGPSREEEEGPSREEEEGTGPSREEEEGPSHKLHSRNVLLLIQTFSCSSRRSPAHPDVLLLIQMFSCSSRRSPAHPDVLLLIQMFSCSSRCSPAHPDVLLLIQMFSCSSRRSPAHPDVLPHVVLVEFSFQSVFSSSSRIKASQPRPTQRSTRRWTSSSSFPCFLVSFLLSFPWFNQVGAVQPDSRLSGGGEKVETGGEDTEEAEEPKE